MVSKRSALGVWFCAAAAAAEWQRDGNLFRSRTTGDGVELEWISQGAFRFSRCAGASCVERTRRPEPVSFEVEETPEGARLRTAYLIVDWHARQRTIRVRAARGNALLLDEQPPAGSLFRRKLAADERLFGLGPRTSSKLDLRGSRVTATHPLLISSAGFGMYVTLPAQPAFDLGHSPSGELHIEAAGPHLEYFFYYGPSPKEILEVHADVAGSIRPISSSQVAALPERFLPAYTHRVPPLPPAETIRYISHASMSGILAPAIAAAAADPAIAATLPLLHGLPVPGRRALLPYLFTYLEEARDRGIPMIRPMAMQYPRDAEAAEATGQFMLGDELLVAASERVYLPAGIWTEIASNEVHKGRQTISCRRGAWFAHNGTILPLEGEEDHRIVLHYLPRLGAEFFLSESGVDDISQIHAGPAGDQLRLEVESRIARKYSWVVHHVSEPVGIEPRLPFRYDHEKRNLHIEFPAEAGSRTIINVRLREPL
jgi:hypothetical protein